jgi:flagellar biosynthesis chaperone FliJ
VNDKDWGKPLKSLHPRQKPRVKTIRSNENPKRKPVKRLRNRWRRNNVQNESLTSLKKKKKEERRGEGKRRKNER